MNVCAGPSTSAFVDELYLLPPNNIPLTIPNADRTILTNGPSLEIVQQPVQNFRFRYDSEMCGSHGSLNAKNVNGKQVYPSVELRNYDKSALIRCSLYQYYDKDDNNTIGKPHGHKLVKKERTVETVDPHYIYVNADQGYIARFANLSIRATLINQVYTELIRKYTILKQEEIARIENAYRYLNPHEENEIRRLAKEESENIDLNVACLRFDAFTIHNDIFYPLCSPVYSNKINNLKNANDLKIVRMDHFTSSCRGGREIFVLVKKVIKDDIKIRFFELDNDQNEVWSDYGIFTERDVHYQHAIVFKTPPYKDVNIRNDVNVFIELEKPSNGNRSNSIQFRYTPFATTVGIKRTRFNVNHSGDNIPPHSLSQQYNEGNIFIRMEHYDHWQDMDGINTIKFPQFGNSLNMEDNYVTKKFDRLDIHEKLEGSLRLKNKEYPKYGHFVSMEDDIDDLPFRQNLPFSDVFDDVTLPKFDDSINKKSYFNRKDVNLSLDTGVTVVNDSIKRMLSIEENLAERIQTELDSFMKTKPSDERVTVMIEALIKGNDFVLPNGNNILHLWGLKVLPYNIFAVKFLALLKNSKQSILLNTTNLEDETPLHVAVASGNTSFVEKLLEASADTAVKDINGNTPLHIAVLKYSSIEMLKLLVKVQHTLGNIYNYDGKTPLHEAVKLNNLDAVKLLIHSRADINAPERKNGYTSLHMAIVNCNIDILNVLLSNATVQCNRNDFYQRTPLELAKMLMDHDNPQTYDIYDVLENYFS